MIQERSGGTKGKRGKTSRDRRSKRVESGKNIRQKKIKESNKIFSKIEGIYGRI